MLSENKTAHRYGQEVQQRPGGPLRQQGMQWKSHSNSDWDDVIGPSIDSIPASQIPVVKKATQPQSFANCKPLTGLICAMCMIHFPVHSKVAFHVSFFLLLLFLVELHNCLPTKLGPWSA